MKNFKFFQKNINDGFDIPFGCEVHSVTPVMIDPNTFDRVKVVLYLNTITQQIVRGPLIGEEHPLWDYEQRTN